MRIRKETVKIIIGKLDLDWIKLNKVRLQQRYLVKVAKNKGVGTSHLAMKGYKNQRNH
jgi:hypothetical protein